jgi:hypothetical protein
MIEVEMDAVIEIPTLSDVIARLQQTPSLTATRRRDLVSGIVRMAQMTGVDLDTTPASLKFMRPFIKGVRPAKYNQTPKTWSNVRSNFRAALVHPGPRERKCSDPEWGALRGSLPDRRMRMGLTRFIGFCEDEAIAPKEVCDAVSDRFRAYLEADTQVPGSACLPPHHLPHVEQGCGDRLGLAAPSPQPSQLPPAPPKQTDH